MIAPLVGGGGIVGLVSAYLGYRASQRMGGRSPAVPEAGQRAIGALVADSISVEQAASAVTALGEAARRLADAADRHHDRLERDDQLMQHFLDEVRAMRRALEDGAPPRRRN